MKKAVVARVAVEKTAYSFDMLFDYSVPSALSEEVLPGKRVLVPFGNSSQKRAGMVFAVYPENSTGKKLKSVISVLDREPMLTREMLLTANYIRENTFCTYFDACKLFLPLGMSVNIKVEYAFNAEFSGTLEADEARVADYLKLKNKFCDGQALSAELKVSADFLDKMYAKGILERSIDAQRRTGDSTVKMVRLLCGSDEAEKIGVTKKQREIVNVLADVNTASIRELCYFTGLSAAVVTALQSKGIAEIYDAEFYRAVNETAGEGEKSEICLSEEQNKAFDGLLKLYKSEKAQGALLYGVTGSGKTQVYLKLIDVAVASGRGVIVMIPEISLTPQLLSIFYKRYGDEIAVFHSALSLGQRLDEWKRIKRGEAKIAVGTRSAVFAPFSDIGLIIMDEEQEHTYKSEMTPRYHAREAAAFRVGRHGGLLVLASATPSVETYTKALNGTYSYFELSNRYGEAVLPQVEVVDTTYQSDMVIENVSKLLAQELKSNFENREQSIILLNRRGYNTFASCTECGTVRTCPNCSISLTYHRKNNRLMCHYCGYSEPFSEVCPSCKNKAVKFTGTGTQKLEEELSEIVPEAKILRMDTDTTASRLSYEQKFRSFAEGEYDIMVGTQMVAKGLDFPNVTLVGVLSVDLMLFNDDYKSAERAFDLITQVVGRSGRGSKPGKAIIQTSFPESEIVSLAKQQDYKSFYNIELPMRKQMIYPPFCDLCAVGFTSLNEALTASAANDFLNALKRLQTAVYKDLNIIVLGPVAPRISKIGGKFRSRIIIKCKNSKNLRAMISQLIKDFSKNTKYKNVSIYADINPENLM